MPRALKKHYSKDPNPWINYLGRKGVKVYPVVADESNGLFKIAVSSETQDKIGSQTYTTKTILDGLYIALEHVYNIEKQKES